MIEETIKRLDEVCVKIKDNKEIHKLIGHGVIYAAFLTDLKEQKIKEDQALINEMLLDINKFCELIEENY